MIEPLYQTKATGDVLLQLAGALGGEIEKALPWNNFKEVLLYGIKGVFEAKRGDTFGLQFDQAWTRVLEKGGWWAPSYKTFEEFWKLLQEKGGWWDPIYDFQEWDRIFQTPSKKFEFYAQGLKRIYPASSKNLKDSSFFSLIGRKRRRQTMEKSILSAFIYLRRWPSQAAGMLISPGYRPLLENTYLRDGDPGRRSIHRQQSDWEFRMKTGYGWSHQRGFPFGDSTHTQSSSEIPSRSAVSGLISAQVSHLSNRYSPTIAWSQGWLAFLLPVKAIVLKIWRRKG